MFPDEASMRIVPAGGFRLVSLSEIDSTNSEVQRRALAGEPAGLVVSAATQTGGRGQHGRSWISPPGNLLVSVLLRPQMAAAQIGQLSFISAVAVALTIDQLAGPGHVQLKWPNDILAGNAKMGGILIESELQAETVDWVVVGVGLNVTSAPENPAYKTMSLAVLMGQTIPVADVLAVFLDHFAGCLKRYEAEGFEPIRRTWEGYAWRLGETVRIKTGPGEVTGSFTALAEDGALLLATAEGRQRITAGSLAYESAA